MVPMNSSASPIMLPNSAVTSFVTRSLSSAAAFSVNVNATMFFGSTSGRRRISTIRCEITWVLPDPAQATISSGSSRVPIAARCAVGVLHPPLPTRRRPGAPRRRSG